MRYQTWGKVLHLIPGWNTAKINTTAKGAKERCLLQVPILQKQPMGGALILPLAEWMVRLLWRKAWDHGLLSISTITGMRFSSCLAYPKPHHPQVLPDCPVFLSLSMNILYLRLVSKFTVFPLPVTSEPLELGFRKSGHSCSELSLKPALWWVWMSILRVLRISRAAKFHKHILLQPL